MARKNTAGLWIAIYVKFHFSAENRRRRRVGIRAVCLTRVVSVIPEGKQFVSLALAAQIDAKTVWQSEDFINLTKL